MAARQHGAISRAQALDCGLSPRGLSRRVAVGELIEVHPGTFVIQGSPPTWKQGLWSGRLWAGDESALSHRSAGAMWELEGIPQGFVEVTVPRVLRSGTVIVHRKKLDAGDTRIKDGLRVTKPARTLLDLGDVLAYPAVERALDDALHRGAVTLGQLRSVLARAGGRGVRGTVILRELVESRDPADARPESTLERRLGRLIKSSDLPRPVPQYEIVGAGGFIARVDFAYPDARLAIEADGYRFHRDKQRWAADLARRTALAAAGWRVLHFTWDDVHYRPAAVIGQIRRSLFGDGRSASI